MRSTSFPLVLRSFALVAVFAVAGYAQNTNSQYKQYSFGPFFTAGASVFQGDVPDGAKTDVGFAYSAGVLGDYMFNSTIGAALGLGYESRSMGFHSQAGNPPSEVFTLSYFSIRPSLKVGDFLIGVNIGAPMSGTAKYTVDNTTNSSASVASKQLGTIVDVRAEGIVPIAESNNGGLYLNVEASYCLSDAISGGFFLPFQTNTANTISKSPIPSLQVGFSYLFSPGGFMK